jgi:hypothetical protein
VTKIDSSILLRCSTSARAEADKFQRQFPAHALELRRIAEGIEAVMRSNEPGDAGRLRPVGLHLRVVR